MKCKPCRDEIAKLKQQLSRYKKMSYKDDLTGLWNKRKLTEDIRRYKGLKKRFGIKFLVLLLDLNNFKTVNDTFGHKVGDKVLQKVAKVLKKNIRNYENVYRSGQGDEFVMIISHYKNYEIVKRRIKRSLAKINIEASIGICEIDKTKCLEIADKNMYKEKNEK